MGSRRGAEGAEGDEMGSRGERGGAEGWVRAEARRGRRGAEWVRAENAEGADCGRLGSRLAPVADRAGDFAPERRRRERSAAMRTASAGGFFESKWKAVMPV